MIGNQKCFQNRAGTKTSTVGSGKGSVKSTLMKEEISSSQTLGQLLLVGEAESGKVHQVYQLPEHQWKEAVTLGSSQPYSGHVSSDKLNLTAVFEAFHNRICDENGKHYSDAQRRNGSSARDQSNEINLQLVQTTEKAEAFINIMFGDRNKDWRSYQSKKFLDALEIIKSNKELFLKFLQNPNSVFLKQTQNLQDLLAEEEMATPIDPEAKISGCGVSNPSAIIVLEPSPSSKKNFKNVACDCSPLHSQYRLKHKQKSLKSSYFSFRDIRRKLKRAMSCKQEQKNRISMDGNLVQLPFDHKGAQSSRDGKSIEKKDQKRDSESGIRPDVAACGESSCKKLSLSTVNCHNEGSFDIILEGKRHLAKRLSKVEKDERSSKEEAPKTLGRIVFLPEHFSCSLSPKREEGFGTAQMRFSPYGNLQMTSNKNENKATCLSPLRQNVGASPGADNIKTDGQLQMFDSMPDALENLISNTNGHGSICSSLDSSSNGFAKNVEPDETSKPRDFYIHKVLSSPNGKNTCADLCNECENLEPSRQESLSKDQALTTSPDVSSSAPLTINKLEVEDSISKRSDHPSPVSVLEPLFLEVTNPIQPDVTFDLGTCTDACDAVSEYVKALLQLSCLNWDELFVRWHSSDQVLNSSPSLFEELEPCPLNSCDKDLLFDCTNEVLSEVLQYYFSCPPWLPSLNSKVPADKNVALEVMRRVNKHLLPPTMACTLDELVIEDMGKSGAWMDFRCDAEDIVFQISESILEEILPRTILES